jgi:hypothetical protein
MTELKELTMCLLLVAGILASACSLQEGSIPNGQQTQQRVEGPVKPLTDCSTVNNGGEVRQQHLLNPIRMAVFQDKSGSSATTRTSQLNEADFTAPISLMRCTGGELAVGIVDDVSNTSLVRLRIEPPPTAPVIAEISNVFERAQLDAEFQQRVNQYDEAVNKWRAQTDSRVGAFLTRLKTTLQQKANARTTNVWSAISRADLFLNESDATWPRPTHRYVVFNSDGVDTARSKPVAIKGGTQIIVVNGVGSTGVFQSLNPERFESMQAAFEFISAKETGVK